MEHTSRTDREFPGILSVRCFFDPPSILSSILETFRQSITFAIIATDTGEGLSVSREGELPKKKKMEKAKVNHLFVSSVYYSIRA